MSIRDQIMAAEDFKSEVVLVPEWGNAETGDLKLVMRELSVNDRGLLLIADSERVEVSGGWDFLPKVDPQAPARIVVLSAYDEAGERVFTDDDVEPLAAKAASVVDRLANVARRLSGMGAVDDEGKAPESGSSETPPAAT